MTNKLIETEKSYLSCIEQFIDEKEADKLLKYVESLPLQKDPKGKIYGKEIVFHRSIGFFSNQSIGYKFSGQMMKTGELTPELNEILLKINSTFNTTYNGILINLYHSGQDYIGAHSDNEKDLDPSNNVIALSLGQTRTFRIRPKNDQIEIKSIHKTNNKRFKTPVYDIPTGHGQVIIMGGEFQTQFTHEIPQEKNKDGLRASLTFRHHKL